MSKAKGTQRETQVRFARFLTVGATAFVVQVLTIHLALHRLHPNVAFVVAYLVGAMTHYLLNRFWALPSSRTDRWRQLRDYLGTLALSFAISFSVFHLGVDLFGLNPTWATALAVPPATGVVFLLLNYRVFRAAEH